MKMIIAGSRSVVGIVAYQTLVVTIHNGLYQIDEVVTGLATGGDALGEVFAEQAKIPMVKFAPDYSLYGDLATYIRNIEMAAYADGLIALWDGRSGGTYHIIETMKIFGKFIYVQKMVGTYKRWSGYENT